MIYQNFDLEIICPQGGNRLCARVLESPQGDCPFIDVKWPFDADTENRLLSEIYGGLRQRRGRSSPASTIQDFGGKLFEAVFAGDIEHLFRSSLDTSFREGKGLRIRLRLPEDSELHMRPWEFLFDTEGREFLAVREHTPLVRYLPVAQPIPPITVEGPLRVLVALSSPTDHPRLDIAREWEILCHALEPSISAGQLVLRRVPGHCTFDNLRDSLRHFGAHIFHFVGHGIPGALVLEQESGKGLEMEATHLRSAFPSGALPRLIVLNACSGAITLDVPFSGLAQGFLRQGVPAVVAMQASITDDAAMIFTRYFYRDLVEIGAVDASLTEARLRMQGNGHPIEWGTPVLYMRALSGQLFQPAANTAVNPDERNLSKEPPARPLAPPPRAEPHLYERKKTRDMPAKPDAAPPPPPPPAAGQGERKKTRVVRVKENAPQLKPGPDPGQQDCASKVQVREVTPAPKPEPEPTAQAIAPKVQPPEYTAHSRPTSTPAAQGIAPTVQAGEPTLPFRPDPEPAANSPPPSTPAAHPAWQPVAPTVQAEELTVPLPPEPKPAGQDIPPKVEAGQHAPPAKQEPALDEDKTLWNVPTRASTPVFTLEPDPELAQQGILGDGVKRTHAAPLARAARIRRMPVYASVAGLLALVLAIGVAKFLPSTGSTPAAPPLPTPAVIPPPTAATITPDPAPVTPPMPTVTPSLPIANSEAERIVPGPIGQDKPRLHVQTKAPDTRPKATAQASRKAQPARKAAPPARSDNCKSAVVSERSAKCLFKK